MKKYIALTMAALAVALSLASCRPIAGGINDMTTHPGVHATTRAAGTTRATTNHNNTTARPNAAATTTHAVIPGAAATTRATAPGAAVRGTTVPRVTVPVTAHTAVPTTARTAVR